jgi:hypothetical protein
VREINDRVERVAEEGRARGFAEAQQQFFGTAASTLLALVFADAAESAAQRIREHDAATADLMHEAALMFRRFGTRASIRDVIPADEATGVATGEPVLVTFESEIEPATVTPENFQIAPASGGGAMNAGLSFTPGTNTVGIIPSNPLSPNVSYRVTVKGNVRALGGQPMGSDYTFTFTTGDA